MLTSSILAQRIDRIQALSLSMPCTPVDRLRIRHVDRLRNGRERAQRSRRSTAQLSMARARTPGVRR
jgi:hypothetical protein